MKNTFLALFVLLVNLGCAQNNSKHITEVSQNDIKKGILVDVRTPEEFEMGHLENALNINWFNADFVQRFNEIWPGVYHGEAPQILHTSLTAEWIDILLGVPILYTLEAIFIHQKIIL